jgi:DNA-3-methyladenine glycosylase I
LPPRQKPPREKPPRIVTTVDHADGVARCPWAGVDPLYVAYHDAEWGVPEWDDRALFEKLILDGFQAGLSWITILRKRDAFRAAFDGFDPKKMARYPQKKFDALMQDAGIVRNRAKIEAATAMARIYLDLEPHGGFAKHIWSFVDGKPLQPKRKSMSEIPVSSEVSERIAKDLRARGGNFVGPTIVYAFMQATGMVNDHLIGCHRHAACASLAKRR